MIARRLNGSRNDIRELMRQYESTSDRPAYQSLSDFLRAAIDAGHLAAGTKLPSERSLAGWVDLSRSTIQAAYRALEEVGYAETRPNVGTVVKPSTQILEDTPSTFRRAFAHHPVIGPGNFLLDLMRSNDRFRRYGFAAGMADPDLFPLNEFQLVLEELLTTRTRDLLGYGLTEGQATLRERIVHFLMRYRSISDIGPENILITTGSMQGLNLVAQAFVEPGNSVAVEDPTFPGAMLIFMNAKANIVPVRVDQNGMEIDALVDALRKRPGFEPKLLYVQPTLQNPSGVSMSTERREQLCKLCADRHLIIVEDDAYGILDSTPGTSAMFASRGKTPMIYLGTFSKLIMPGLRVGFVVADPGVIRQLTLLKQVADLHSSGMSQLLVEGWLAIGNVEAYVEKCRATYAHRLALALNDEFFLDMADIPLVPRGGFYIFGQFKGGSNSRVIRDAAQAAGVSFALGEHFSVTSQLPNYFRLSISTASEKSIHVGLLRLRQAINGLQLAP